MGVGSTGRWPLRCGQNQGGRNPAFHAGAGFRAGLHLGALPVNLTSGFDERKTPIYQRFQQARQRRMVSEVYQIACG
jgi:hypothetical protein